MDYTSIIKSHIFNPYNERNYHNKEHILQVLKSNKTWNTTQMYAILFHDLVYSPISNTNEELSAKKAKEHLLSFNISDVDIGKVYQIILATKSHKATNDREIDLVLDADCSILGSDREMYARYVTAIRKEYFMFNDDEYKEGRLKFLRSFKGFITPEYKVLDKKAEDNILFEIGLL